MKKLNLQICTGIARCLLRIGLGVTTLAAVAVLVSFLQITNTAPIGAIYIHRAMLEYLIAGASISVGGALLVELICMESAKK